MNILPDLVKSNLDVIFCGTAVSKASEKRAAYYAGRGNAFWPTLHKLGFTPSQFSPEQYQSLLQLRFGLTDLTKTSSGNDRDLGKSCFDRERLTKLISQYQPKVLAFTSKRAAEEYLGRKVDYGKVPEKISATTIFVLPSPSGAARRYWTELPWIELSRLIQA